MPPELTENPLEVSDRILATGEIIESFNRVTNKVSELDEGISIVESFSHVISFDTGDELVCFDSSGAMTGTAVVEALRSWSEKPVHSMVYTHGHVDHTGGSGAFAADADSRGHEAPQVVAHEGVRHRLDRYELTNGWNNAINRRQFGGVAPSENLGIGGMGARFLPEDALWPTVEYTASHELAVGDHTFELFHDRGETDDHTWAWVPQHKALCVGDFVTWVFPNCGNPQKVQRFPAEWAVALRKMMAYDAEWLFGAHGLPVRGAVNVNRILEDLALALEKLVGDTLEMMNANESLDSILHTVALPPEMIKPWMIPVYDEPEFVVRNIWRQYGGWWDLNPANLKPAPESAVAEELSALIGGSSKLVERAQELAAVGDLKLACHLIEIAAKADPSGQAMHEARAAIYQQRRDTELSLMSKGIFAAAANESAKELESKEEG
ncbi:MAG: MBL fold metallo-hydrolase [Acidimicrobiales bacterium]|nr:MBL fold metallo-hydrolase [Acidimicrobiales bacterium]RZV43754.1 MAG: MBL fold metallo-hydrolase [Acidimicrobiales bacterium]